MKNNKNLNLQMVTQKGLVHVPLSLLITLLSSAAKQYQVTHTHPPGLKHTLTCKQIWEWMRNRYNVESIRQALIQSEKCTVTKTDI